MYPLKKLLLACLVAGMPAVSIAVLPAPAFADQTDKATFDLSVRGFTAGTVQFSGAEKSGAYSVVGQLQTSGLVGFLRKIRYDARASGAVRGGQLVPSRYEEDADTGKRISESVMEYRSGVPQVKVYNPPRPPRDGGVDPASQGGTVDPLTALYAVMRDVPEQAACDRVIPMFDGRRATRLTLSKPAKSGERIVCAGEYRRVAGFSPEDMSEKTRFPFQLTLAPVGDGMYRVVEVSMDSLYGKAALKRR